MSGCREEWHAFYYPIREAQFWRTTKFHARSINNFPGAVGGSLMGRVLHLSASMCCIVIQRLLRTVKYLKL